MIRQAVENDMYKILEIYNDAILNYYLSKNSFKNIEICKENVTKFEEFKGMDNRGDVSIFVEAIKQ